MSLYKLSPHQRKSHKGTERLVTTLWHSSPMGAMVNQRNFKKHHRSHFILPYKITHFPQQKQGYVILLKTLRTTYPRPMLAKVKTMVIMMFCENLTGMPIAG